MATTAQEDLPAAFRVPTEPYPGLRPFLDYEAALLLGRKHQVAEIVARLQASQFVAVIGGSGSGKSSLIRAGLVPELRSFGMPAAGDYWVPIVCTPGTTACAPQGPGQTPITRLAWKLSQALDPATLAMERRLLLDRDTPLPERPLDPDAEARMRRNNIATIFRQGAGFARLVDGYTQDLPMQGPEREHANFLFVIDQFEELFHRNNHDNPDARAMVEAVIDHFFNPHPRCFVLLTMRSEHLADCAGYLELPDAINKSCYLVRRLDEAELHEAIVGPAKYFLRLSLRGRSSKENEPPLPEDVVFEEAVVARLLSDVGRITDDPDHLPLLQHVLARCWRAACLREGPPGGACTVPAQILWADLEQAVVPSNHPAAGHQPAGWLRLDAGVNSLRSSLENWAQAAYDKRPPEQQQQIDGVLRQLAYRDPNNGQYTQQRLVVDDPRLFPAGPGMAQQRAMLRQLLEQDFLDTVNYLFWDRENPDQVTLKVSHESFIRGWEHFRSLVDAEAERFEEFVAVLRRCALWQQAPKPEMLLENAELLRFDAARLGPALASPEERRDWFRVLGQFRDGERFGKMEAFIDPFLAASRAQVQAEEQARLEGLERTRQDQLKLHDANTKRRHMYVLSALLLLLILAVLPRVLFSYVVQDRVLHAADKFTRARLLAGSIPGPNAPINEGQARPMLTRLQEAAGLIMETQKEADFVMNPGWKLWLAGKLGGSLPDVQKVYINTSSEQTINGSMRAWLISHVWHEQGKAPALLEQARRVDDKRCEITFADGAPKPMAGSLFLLPKADRYLFFAKMEPDFGDIPIYTAELGADGSCHSKTKLLSVPRFIAPRMLLDGRLRYLAVAQTADTGSEPAVSFYKIQWKAGEEGLERFSVVIGEKATQPVLAEFERRASQLKTLPMPEVLGVDTWAERGGFGLSVAGQSWRLFSDSAQPIANGGGNGSGSGSSNGNGADNPWQTLLAPPPDSPCAALHASLLGKPTIPGFVVETLQQGRFCYAIQRGSTARATAPGSGNSGNSVPPNPQVLVTVYDAAGLALQPDKNQAAWIASLTLFDGRPEFSGDWLVGTDGPYKGWIAKRKTSAAGQQPEIYAAPWSAQALAQLAAELPPAAEAKP